MKRKVLVVDDNMMNRKILCKILSEEYEVFQAVNGKEALDILVEKYDTLSAVLLDLKMPVMDGYAVLQAMRSDAKFSQIPVIVTTGDSESRTEMKALDMGANDFAAKPYNAGIIKLRLRNLIKIREDSAIVNATKIDALTGLNSRAAFFEQVEELVARHEPGYYVMASFDVDKFKILNDQYGNSKGDEILKSIAHIFKKGFKNIGGICCRIAADDFAVLYPRVFIDSEEVTRIRYAAAILDGSISPISFSIGRYIIEDLSLPPSTMYDRAAMAEKSVKGRFDRNIAVYDESMRVLLLREQNIISEMKSALEDGQFEVWLQPQYDHSEGILIGAEALARWRHPLRGMISPGDFIPIFERNGFIYQLDMYIWRSTCGLLRKWIDRGLEPLPVSVNISRYDVFRGDLTEMITGYAKEYGIPHSLLRLEITESAFSRTTEQIISVVKDLIALGFTVEIDDFGSGYSSLNTLKDVPAQILKLDMRFFEGSENALRGGSIIECVVKMSEKLGMSVIAEGVETKEQADFLKSVGCKYIQGFFYSKPLCVPDYEELLRNSMEDRETA